MNQATDEGFHFHLVDAETESCSGSAFGKWLSLPAIVERRRADTATGPAVGVAS
ncbi:hypothetical protein SH668x_001770 [Planctomicrobium sp. SH668]|uniref:hypothetical protein n=1 Tax=Planctomicrobium sp. SH668 TaxID=3448126 RepID=UPI003F5BDBD5